MVESKTPVGSNPVADCLRAARKKIENPKNWWRGGDPPTTTGKCMWTALEEPYDFVAIKFLRAVIGTHDVDEWNDAPGRTHGEVLAAFDEAIELAERKART